MIAINRHNSKFVIVNPNTADCDIKSVVSELNISYAFASKENKGIAACYFKYILCIDECIPVCDCNYNTEPLSVDLNEILGYFMSSGSTGQPKIYSRSFYSLFSESVLWQVELQLRSNTTLFISRPLSYIGSFVLAYATLFFGGTLIVPRSFDDNFLFVDNCLTTVDWGFLAPGVIKKYRSIQIEIAFNNVITMGAPISTNDKLSFESFHKTHVFEMWGNADGLATINNESKKTCYGSTYIGRPTFTDKIVIVNENRNILDYGNIGYLAGYTDNSCGDIESSKESRLIVSDDIGFIDDHNDIYLIGRKQNVAVISDGEYISAEFVEAQLQSTSDVDECIVVLSPDIQNSKPTFVVFTTNATDEQKISVAISGLSFADIVVEVMVIDGFPYTPNGKINYSVLHKYCTSRGGAK
jgi:acyl-coenzyme A synthetase/AMP-(fatty) acid ligase